MKNILEFKNFSVSLKNDKKILNNIDIQIKEKEILGIVGESGSGKTTLLNFFFRYEKIYSYWRFLSF